MSETLGVVSVAAVVAAAAAGTSLSLVVLLTGSSVLGGVEVDLAAATGVRPVTIGPARIEMLAAPDLTEYTGIMLTELAHVILVALTINNAFTSIFGLSNLGLDRYEPAVTLCS